MYSNSLKEKTMSMNKDDWKQVGAFILVFIFMTFFAWTIWDGAKHDHQHNHTHQVEVSGDDN